jgi:hypothetical protein
VERLLLSVSARSPLHLGATGFIAISIAEQHAESSRIFRSDHVLTATEVASIRSVRVRFAQDC